VWRIKELLLENPDLGVVVNTSNEYAINKFLNKVISFGDISSIILKCIEKFNKIKINNIEDIFEIKNEIKAFCESDII